MLTNGNGRGGIPAWIQLSPSGGPPPGQYAPTAVYDPASNRMTVFAGGAEGTGSSTNAVWVLSNANGLGGAPVWTNLIAEGTVGSPPVRGFHSAVYDTAANRMTIFGGAGGPTGRLNDVWVLANANGLGATPTWTQLSPTGGPPAPRCCHGAILDVATNRMNVFAGDANQVTFNDTWVLTNANGCREADGEGDVPGKSGGTAHFRFHQGHCESGEQDSEEFSDASSGTNFQSTQVTGVTYDDVAHSVTIGGLGIDNGLTVAFTIIAVDSTVVPPGMFSITLSDGYTNSGSLLTGSILLR